MTISKISIIIIGITLFSLFLISIPNIIGSGTDNGVLSGVKDSIEQIFSR